MALFSVPESLFLTVTFAALSGLFLTLATAVTHYPAHIDRLAKAAAGEDCCCEEKGISNFNDDEEISQEQQQQKGKPTMLSKAKASTHNPAKIGLAMADAKEGGCEEEPLRESVSDDGGETSEEQCEETVISNYDGEICKEQQQQKGKPTMLSKAKASTHNPAKKGLAKADAEEGGCEEELLREIVSDDGGETSEEQQEQKNKKPKKVSKGMWKIAYGMNLLLAAIGGTLNLVGTWFGPVSLFVPIKQVCQIISGMITFSYILKTEPKPSKDTSVGNYIIMLSAIMLIFVGPKIQEEPIDVEELLSKEKTHVFVGVILLAFGITFPFQFVLSCTNIPTTDRVNFIFLLLSEVVSAVVGNSASKLFPLLEISDPLFILNLILLVMAFLTVAFTSILRSTVVLSQVEYLPLMLSCNIFLNGLVGLILWEDDIINIGGYTCVYFFFVMGVYLVSDYGYEILPGTTLADQVSPENQNAVVNGLIHGRARTIHSARNIRMMMSQCADMAYSSRSETTDCIIDRSTLSVISEVRDAPDNQDRSTYSA